MYKLVLNHYQCFLLDFFLAGQSRGQFNKAYLYFRTMENGQDYLYLKKITSHINPVGLHDYEWNITASPPLLTILRLKSSKYLRTVSAQILDVLTEIECVLAA